MSFWFVWSFFSIGYLFLDISREEASWGLTHYHGQSLVALGLNSPSTAPGSWWAKPHFLLLNKHFPHCISWSGYAHNRQWYANLREFSSRILLCSFLEHSEQQNVMFCSKVRLLFRGSLETLFRFNKNCAITTGFFQTGTWEDQKDVSICFFECQNGNFRLLITFCSLTRVTCEKNMKGEEFWSLLWTWLWGCDEKVKYKANYLFSVFVKAFIYWTSEQMLNSISKPKALGHNVKSYCH